MHTWGGSLVDFAFLRAATGSTDLLRVEGGMNSGSSCFSVNDILDLMIIFECGGCDRRTGESRSVAVVVVVMVGKARKSGKVFFLSPRHVLA